jgi:hypothetical protein
MTSASTTIAPRTASPAAGAGALSWLKSGRGLLVLAAAAGIAALASGGYWFGFAAIAPLLFLLPCAVMMAHCMKGMGNGESQCSEKGAAAQRRSDAWRQK